MILIIGEILADMIGEYKAGALQFNAFCGGAPYNVAVNAKKAGANVAFVGRVGDDVIGRFLSSEGKKANLDCFDLQIDSYRNTTLAFVSLLDGERTFTFNRNDTADYHIDYDKIDFSAFDNVNLVDVGSLMLSEACGRELSAKIVAKTKEIGAKLCFDVNFRMDIYKSFDEARLAYAPLVVGADIVKFSEDEILQYAESDNLDDAVSKVIRKNQLVLITLGSKGSAYYLNDLKGVVPALAVKPLDTTGAGDAFFGTFLAKIEGKEWSSTNIENALHEANRVGAETTQFFGAVKFD